MYLDDLLAEDDSKHSDWVLLFGQLAAFSLAALDDLLHSEFAFGDLLHSDWVKTIPCIVIDFSSLDDGFAAFLVALDDSLQTICCILLDLFFGRFATFCLALDDSLYSGWLLYTIRCIFVGWRRYLHSDWVSEIPKILLHFDLSLEDCCILIGVNNSLYFD